MWKRKINWVSFWGTKRGRGLVAAKQNVELGPKGIARLVEECIVYGRALHHPVKIHKAPIDTQVVGAMLFLFGSVTNA